jgi:hypothetical protein
MLSQKCHAEETYKEKENQVYITEENVKNK